MNNGSTIDKINALNRRYARQLRAKFIVHTIILAVNFLAIMGGFHESGSMPWLNLFLALYAIIVLFICGHELNTNPNLQRQERWVTIARFDFPKRKPVQYGELHYFEHREWKAINVRHDVLCNTIELHLVETPYYDP